MSGNNRPAAGRNNKRPAGQSQRHDPAHAGPDIAGVVQRLRKQSGLSLNQVAKASGLSASFLSAVERDQSDISVQRLARVAAVFNHDVGSLLGYSERRTTPQAVPKQDRILIDRGPGVDYEVVRIPETGLTLFISDFAPHTAFSSALSHAGHDVCYILEGSLVLEFDGEEYTMRKGDCLSWPGSYPHLIRNDTGRRARLVAVTTEIVF